MTALLLASKKTLSFSLHKCFGPLVRQWCCKPSRCIEYLRGERNSTRSVYKNLLKKNFKVKTTLWNKTDLTKFVLVLNKI